MADNNEVPIMLPPPQNPPVNSVDPAMPAAPTILLPPIPNNFNIVLMLKKLHLVLIFCTCTEKNKVLLAFHYDLLL